MFLPLLHLLSPPHWTPDSPSAGAEVEVGAEELDVMCRREGRSSG